jgi:hypothetical protein
MSRGHGWIERKLVSLFEDRQHQFWTTAGLCREIYRADVVTKAQRVAVLRALRTSGADQSAWRRDAVRHQQPLRRGTKRQLWFRRASGKGESDPLPIVTPDPAEEAMRILARIDNDYGKLEILLGRNIAQQQIRALTEMRRGAPTGPRNPKTDFELMLLHEALITLAERQARNWSVGETAGFAERNFRFRYGATRKAVEMKLRRHLSGRDIAMKQRKLPRHHWVWPNPLLVAGWNPMLPIAEHYLRSDISGCPEPNH